MSFLHKIRMVPKNNRNAWQHFSLALVEGFEYMKAAMFIAAGVLGMLLVLLLPFALIGGFYGIIIAVAAKTFFFLWHLIL
jgi:fatty acid desaturase